jgi:hypothetical protein
MVQGRAATTGQGRPEEVKRGEQRESVEGSAAIKDPDGRELIFIADLG